MQGHVTDNPLIGWCLPHRGLGRELDPVRGRLYESSSRRAIGQTRFVGSLRYLAWRVIRSCYMCVQYLQERLCCVGMAVFAAVP